MSSMLRLNEKVPCKGRLLRVTELDIASIPKVREHLVGLARQGSTTTYKDLVRDARLPHPPHGLGRLLNLVGEDCDRRGEPDLAALVVTAATGEVGSEYGGGPDKDREAVYRHWAR